MQNTESSILKEFIINLIIPLGILVLTGYVRTSLLELRVGPSKSASGTVKGNYEFTQQQEDNVVEPVVQNKKPSRKVNRTEKLKQGAIASNSPIDK